MSNKIVVKNLYKIFGDAPNQALDLLDQGMNKEEIFQRTGQTVAVNDACFTVLEGEIFVIMGLSGSGKSTLVRLLNRLIDPTSGQIIYDGVDIATFSADRIRQLRRTDLSMVFQSFALMPHLNILDNTAFGLELAHVAKPERHNRAREALSQVGLEAYESSYPDELSGGMQQRVGLARALANDPTVMLMDEAFSALDPLIRTEMQRELLNLQRDSKRTVIFISHDLDEAMRIGDRIAIMEGGRIVQIGSPEEILNNPADDYVHSFFQGVNVTSVLSAADICRRHRVTMLNSDDDIESATAKLHRGSGSHGYVLDSEESFVGIVSKNSIREAVTLDSGRLADAFIAGIETLPADMLLKDLIGKVSAASCGLPVVSINGHFLGVISRALLLDNLDRAGEING